MLAFDTRERLDRFIGAAQAVIERHDILRTAVMWEGLPQPVQVVWRQARLMVEEVVFGSGDDAAAQLRERFDPRHYRLDVRQAPLQRAFIGQDQAQDRWLLLLLSHHLTIDHTTLEVIFGDMQAHLLGESQHLTAAVPFRNFVAQARGPGAIGAEEHERFFRQMLGDIEESTAPFGLLDVQGDGGGISEARLLLEPRLCEQIRNRARAAGVSAASVCHLAWGQVLARLTGRQEVVFGTVLFGRLQGGEGVERGVGPFINTLPLRVSVGEGSVQQGLRSTHEQLGQLLRHEHASLAQAQRCSAVPAPLPLFTTLLNYRYSSPATAGGQRAWEGITSLYGEERTNYPLTLSVDDLGEGFALTAQVNASIDPQRICELMHTALQELARALEQAPKRALHEVDVLPRAEREQILVKWNATQAEYPADKCIHELFEEQVRRTPAATAVVYEDRSLSYAQLNEQANRLAHYLMQRGVGPDSRVGICLERSLEMVVGLLAILKAGGAYVPLDPSYPSQRLAYLLTDSEPVLLLGDDVGLESVSGAALSVPLVHLHADAPRWAQCSAENPQVHGLTSRHLAYIISPPAPPVSPRG